MLPSLLTCCSTGMIYIPSAQLETSCSTALENQTASSLSKAEIQELEFTRRGRWSPNSFQNESSLPLFFVLRQQDYVAPAERRASRNPGYTVVALLKAISSFWQEYTSFFKSCILLHLHWVAVFYCIYTRVAAAPGNRLERVFNYLATLFHAMHEWSSYLHSHFLTFWIAAPSLISWN